MSTFQSHCHGTLHLAFVEAAPLYSWVHTYIHTYIPNLPVLIWKEHAHSMTCNTSIGFLSPTLSYSPVAAIASWVCIPIPINTIEEAPILLVHQHILSQTCGDGYLGDGEECECRDKSKSCRYVSWLLVHTCMNAWCISAWVITYLDLWLYVQSFRFVSIYCVCAYGMDNTIAKPTCIMITSVCGSE